MTRNKNTTNTIVLLIISVLLIWIGYHEMAIERWADKYLYFMWFLGLLIGIAIMAYLLWFRE